MTSTADRPCCCLRSIYRARSQGQLALFDFEAVLQHASEWLVSGAFNSYDVFLIFALIVSPCRTVDGRRSWTDSIIHQSIMTTCYREENGAVTSFTGWELCTNYKSSEGNYPCCLPNNICLEGSICYNPDIVGITDASGYYMAICTDESYSDGSVCPRQCSEWRPLCFQHTQFVSHFARLIINATQPI